MVAVGNLNRVWLDVPHYASSEELHKAFQNYFGAEWEKVLNAVDKSSQYNTFNDTYFLVDSLKPLENITLDKIFEDNSASQMPNIIVS